MCFATSRFVSFAGISKLGSTLFSLSGKCVGSLSCRIAVSAHTLRLSLLIGGRSGGACGWRTTCCKQGAWMDPAQPRFATAAAFDEATRQTAADEALVKPV